MYNASLSWEEWVTLKKFGDSLLSRCKKLVELSGQLDEALKADESSPHGDRVQKYFTQILVS